MAHRAAFMLVSSAICALAGCGGGNPAPGATTTTPGTQVAGRPALARVPAKPGELVFSGEASPTTRGPIALDGRYVVRFEQIAPEDPHMDFSAQTPFTAALERRAGDPRGAVKLFGAAARSGRRELRLRGRYVLDVSFGDFPYAVRFTPRR
jgi:hypothetical protein